jgi:hypothetical protein
MTRDELQAALDSIEWPVFDDHYVIIEAARSWLRLLPLNGQWDEEVMEKLCAVLDDWYVEAYEECARAVLSALTEEVT